MATPASDMLANQVLFLPAAASISKLEELRLASACRRANHDALPIRVAIIASPSDLGAVTELWDKPRAYARFLGLELALTRPGRRARRHARRCSASTLPCHSAPATYALVGRSASGRSGPALVDAAQAAVMSIAQSRPRPSARPRDGWQASGCAHRRRGDPPPIASLGSSSSPHWRQQRRLPLLHSLALRRPDAEGSTRESL